MRIQNSVKCPKLISGKGRSRRNQRVGHNNDEYPLVNIE
jgi:hypothetical protein